MSDASTGLGGPIDPSVAASLPVPIRIGAWVELADGALRGHLRVHPQILRHGVIDLTAYATVVDMMGGLAIDTSPDDWVFTSTMSIRAVPVPAPSGVDSTVTVLRDGARSSTSEIELVAPDGSEVAVGFTGFSRVGRREGDLPKPEFDLAEAGPTWSQLPLLDEPVRDAAGLRVVEAGAGVVEVDVVPLVANPAGALHGAMTAMVVVAAAEELSDAACGGAHVAVDLDLRYLAQARVGPVRTTARFVGDPAQRTVVVHVLDAGRDDLLLAVATVRTHPVN